MMRTFVRSVGLLGPGLSSWETGRAILAGEVAYQPADMPKPVPDILQPTERRRSSDAVRLAVAVAQEAMTSAGIAVDSVATVFTSADGDGWITHKICELLAAPEREVSPTLFHNSVYNAPAGYWSIATGSRQPSTSVCAYDASFAAGLLEAASQVTMERQPVLLVAFDLPLPYPLHSVRPVEQPLAAAFLLFPETCSASLGTWEITVEQKRTPSPIPETLPDSFQSNSVGRCLPLLQAVARRCPDTVWLEYINESCVAVRCHP